MANNLYKLIFQNEHFLIVDKSANVLTVPSRMGSDDERNCLGIQLGHDFKVKILPVHRLDFEVSGLVMFATTAAAQKAGNNWFEHKTVLKTYEALTSKSSEVSEFLINQKLHWECLLMKGKKRAYEAPFGKKAITEANLLEKFDQQFYRFHLNPITGRSHQLRYELFRHGHPILGDKLYGSTLPYQKGIALRSFKIDFNNCPERTKFDLPSEIKISGLELAV